MLQVISVNNLVCYGHVWDQWRGKDNVTYSLHAANEIEIELGQFDFLTDCDWMTHREMKALLLGHRIEMLFDLETGKREIEIQDFKNPKKVNYYPLHDGLAEISDNSGAFLCQKENVYNTLKEIGSTPCASICTDNTTEDGKWYIYVPKRTVPKRTRK